MQSLINQLRNLTPSTLNRRAADAIQQLYNLGQVDLRARTELEQKQGFEPITLEYCKEIYSAVVNQEYQDANS